jgi:hypothetical protein
MSGDLLEQATRALRETTAEPQPRSGLTRARLLESAEKRYVSRRFGLLRWVIALVAALAASTALARVAQYWPEIKRAIAPAASEPAVAPKRKAATKHPLQPMAASTDLPLSAAGAPAPEIAPAAEASAPKGVPSSEARPGVVPSTPATPAPRRPKSKAPRPKPAARPDPSPARKPSFEPEAIAMTPAPDPVLGPKPAPESAELALFRRAQRMHLAQDPRALAAWDDYLRVASRGVLAPEARYNRALCLIRLGRKSDARSALTPFANGEYGSYRRTEAKALIQALDRTHE